MAHPSFPLPTASDAELLEFVLKNIDDSNQTGFFYGVIEVPILSAEGIALLGARTSPITGQGGSGVGSMHNYGTDIIQRFPRLCQELTERLNPLFDFLFRGAPSPLGITLHSAHSIAYGMGPTRETALKLHVDDSKYTATICVVATPDLCGTQLVFHGQQALASPRLAEMQEEYARARRSGGVDVKDTEDSRNHIVKLPRAGHALLHLGKHMHRTLPVEKGERHSWVLWWHELQSPC